MAPGKTCGAPYVERRIQLGAPHRSHLHAASVAHTGVTMLAGEAYRARSGLEIASVAPLRDSLRASERSLALIVRADTARGVGHGCGSWVTAPCA
jgi:hypothetical protein